MDERARRAIAAIREDPEVDHDPEEPDTVWQGLLDGHFSLVEQFERGGNHCLVARRNHPRRPGLTARERKVVAWAARGYSNLEISFEMHLSEVAVAAHLATAAGKLGLESRKALVEAASLFVDVQPAFE